jgi:protoheme IX farnesyltransferase
VLAFVGLPVLDVFVNPVTAFIGGAALLSYVLAYTPMKRVSSLAVWVGAVPGAVPPLMGWTAMTGTPTLGGLSLFLLLFVWQIPHFHAIAIFRTEEYERAGLRVLPSERGLPHTKRAIVALLVLQLAVSALPVVAGLGGVRYAVVATLAGVAHLAYGIRGLSPDAGEAWARKLFFLSLPYLLVVLGALVVDAG